MNWHERFTKACNCFHWNNEILLLFGNSKKRHLRFQILNYVQCHTYENKTKWWISKTCLIKIASITHCFIFIQQRFSFLWKKERKSSCEVNLVNSFNKLKSVVMINGMYALNKPRHFFSSNVMRTLNSIENPKSIDLCPQINMFSSIACGSKVVFITIKNV